MAEKTEFYRWTFEGYDKALYSQSHTLAEILPELKIDESYVFTGGTSDWEIARKVESCTVKRLGGSGSIPFIFVVPYEYHTRVYIKQINYQINANNNITYFTWTQTDARARDSSTSTYEMDNYGLTQLNFTLNNPPYQDYLYSDSAVWVNGLVTFPIIYNTNIPIFKVAENFDWNSESSDLKDTIHSFMLHLITPEDLIDGERILEILNAENEEVPETTEYFYYGRANQITVNQYGEISKTSAPQLIKGFRVKTTGRVSLYATEGIDDGHLKFMINMSDVEIAYYSYDLDTWQNQQGSPTTLPFDFVWRGWTNEIGTFYCSGTKDNPLFETNCLYFYNKADSDHYNETGEGGEKAENWNEISNNSPIFNPTGLDDETTVFGEVYAQAMFTQQYICSTSALREIANAFFDTTQGGISGIFEDIKKGLEMYGEGSGVVDAVQGCTFYPFDLNQVFTQVLPQNYIYFGGYKFDMQNNVNKIIYPNGYIDFGTFTIERTFNSYRDYAPYQRLYVYLPYLAWYELDLNKYLGKSVNVRYYIDTRSGGLCMAVLSVNGVMTDYMCGQIGVAYPMTLTDYSRFASAQLQTLLGGGKGVLSQGGNVAQTTQNMAELGASASEIAVGGLALGSVGVAFQGAKTLYGLTQNNINNFNKTIGSGATSMLNEYLPQEVCFMFEIQEADETPNERMLQGYPSNSSGTIGSFSGYLEVDTVNLVCADATANEKAQIVSMLKSGVYI